MRSQQPVRKGSAPVTRIPLREQVREWILESIANARFVPGDRMMEDKLAAELNVSAIPVREAIRELVTMGVLESEANKGAWVRKVELSETVEALQVRSALEALAARLAARQVKDHVRELRTIAESIVAAACKRNFKAFQKHNQRFHRGIVSSAGNRVLLRVWDSLSYEVGARWVIRSMPDVDPVALARDHVAIVEAFEAGDYESAAAMLAGHHEKMAEWLGEGDAGADSEKHARSALTE